MKITFDELESLVIAETHADHPSDRYPYEIFEQALPMLYIAARFGEIEMVDALMASSKSIEIAGIICRKFLTREHVDEVRQVIAQISLNFPRDRDNRFHNFALEYWLVRNEK